MKLSETLKPHILKRLPAIIVAVLLTAVFGLYYLGVYDVSFIERPESWKNNFSYLKEAFQNGKPEDVQQEEPEDTEKPEETPPANYPETNKGHKKSDKESKYEEIIIKPVSELKKNGYSLTSKVWDSSCVMGKLNCSYKWPIAFSYGEKNCDMEKFTYYDDGTETKREVVREKTVRPALEMYMGYILYDDRGTLYLVNSDGGVMTKYDDDAYIPAYTRDKNGRPLFYKSYETSVPYPTKLGKPDANGEKPWLETQNFKTTVKKYYYLSESGQYFLESDYNDLTDNRGLYFDYPAYYGNTDSNFKRYYFNTTALHTTLDWKTQLLHRLNWMYSEKEVKLSELSFDKNGNNLKTPGGDTLGKMFPYTMAYNYRENYASVKMDIKWDYNHDVDDGKGGKKNEYVEVTSNEMRVIDKTGKVMFNSRKNYFSELGWTANERFVDPLSLGIDSIGSYYFDHGLMRMRVQSYDRFYFTDLKMMFIVTDDDILVRPDGTKFNIPSGYKLKGYSDGILLLEKDGKFGYLTSKNTWLKEGIYTDAKPFLEGVAVCALNGKYGVINNAGKTIVPFEYDSISNISSGTMVAYKDGEGWSVLQKLAK